MFPLRIFHPLTTPCSLAIKSHLPMPCLELSPEPLQNPTAAVPTLVVMVLNQVCLTSFAKCHEYCLTPSCHLPSPRPVDGTGRRGRGGDGVRTRSLLLLLFKPVSAVDTGQVRATPGQLAIVGKAAGLGWVGEGLSEARAHRLSPPPFLPGTQGPAAWPTVYLPQKGPVPTAPTSLPCVQLVRRLWLCRWLTDDP